MCPRWPWARSRNTCNPECNRLGINMAKIEMPTSSAGGGAARAPATAVQDRPFGMWSRSLVGPALVDSLRKLSPAAQLKNPVMFVVYVGSILTTLLWVMALRGQAEAPAGFILAITVWLWFTVLFANFAEALAEGRSKAQAASLRGLRKDTWAKKLKGESREDGFLPIQAPDLRRGDVVLVEAGD